VGILLEIRRVQMTGGSSFIITLPKEWVKNLNIRKNDPIGLIQQPDGSLLVTPKMEKEHEKRTITFDIEHGIDQDFLFRKLIGSYIAGYNSVTIKTKPRIQPSTRSTIRRYIQSTIGQEIVEETDSAIIIKDLLNPSEMPLQRTIKRMHIIVKGMFEDAIQLLKNDTISYEDIAIRDNEVDRLHWLVARQHRIIQNNVNFVEKMGITIGTSTTAYLISRIVERIGDHVNRIAEEAQVLYEKKIDEDLIKKIESASRQSLSLLNNSIGSFSKKEMKSANDTIEKAKGLKKICEEIDTLALNKKGQTAIAIGYIVESIRRIGDYSQDIAECVINHLVGEQNS